MIRLEFINNYGNEKAIREILAQHNIEVIGKSYSTGLMGCDPPVAININTDLNVINEIIKNNEFPDTIFKPFRI